VGEKSTFEASFLREEISSTKGKFFALAATDLAPSVKGIERSALQCLQETWFAKDANTGQRPLPSDISAGTFSIALRIPPDKLRLPVVIIRQ
jgi:hypothetical protein